MLNLVEQDIHEIKIIISQLSDNNNFKLKRWLIELLQVKEMAVELEAKGSNYGIIY